MVSQPPKDTPFGLEPNIAAGLAYLLSVVGGIIMLAGGGTNRLVKWSACQSIVLFIVWFVVRVALGILAGVLQFLWPIMFSIYALIGLIFFIAWIVCVIYAFQGKDVRLPIVASITQTAFANMLR